MKNLIENGKWSNSTEFYLYESDESFDESKATAVFAIVENKGKIVLTKTKRNEWEPLGGHIEEGESIEDAMKRECLEEGGVKITNYIRIGFSEALNTEDILDDDGNIKYPKGSTYIPLYVASSEEKTYKPTGIEVEKAGFFSPSEVEKMKRNSNIETFLLGIKYLEKLGYL